MTESEVANTDLCSFLFYEFIHDTSMYYGVHLVTNHYPLAGSRSISHSTCGGLLKRCKIYKAGGPWPTTTNKSIG